jgi:hypothetical protein
MAVNVCVLMCLFFATLSLFSFPPPVVKKMGTLSSIEQCQQDFLIRSLHVEGLHSIEGSAAWHHEWNACSVVARVRTPAEAVHRARQGAWAEQEAADQEESRRPGRRQVPFRDDVQVPVRPERKRRAGCDSGEGPLSSLEDRCKGNVLYETPSDMFRRRPIVR